MKKCLSCKLEVKSNRKTCPLCGELLEGESSKISTYPEFKTISKSINLFLRITLFIVIVASIVTSLINIFTYKGTFWAGYAIVGLWYSLMVIKFTILSERNMAKKLFIHMLLVSFVVIIIEKISRTSGWALAYVVPCNCSLTIVVIIILILSKQMRFNDYLLYLITTIVINFIPMILYWSSVVDVLWPSVTSGVIGIITIIGMIIFADTATKDELKKRFHI